MKPLKIILVMLEPPLPFGNAVARWYWVLVRELVARGHQVRAFAACSKADEIPKAVALFPAPQYNLKLYPFPQRSGIRSKLGTLRRPFSYMFSDALKADLAAAQAEGYDVLHLENLWCSWLAANSNRVLINVHFLARIDLAEVRHANRLHRFQQWLMTSAERRLLKRQNHFVTLSDRLRDAIHSLNPAAPVSIVPLGLDTSLYAYLPDTARGGEPVISVIGSMGWHPSRSAAVRLLTRLWPTIHERVPTARLQIVGWEARSALAAYLDTPGVTIEENVPDMQPYFARTSVLLYAPARGSGMKVKILEALAYGVPVVTTSEGVEGLPATDGVHAGIAEDDAGLIARTVALLNDPAAQNRQRVAGRRLIETHCGPKPTVDALEAAYQRLLTATGAA